MTTHALEGDINAAVRMDGPISKGPLPRWQKKALESSGQGGSFLSTSALMASSFNASAALSNISSSKTPSKTPRRTPGKSNHSLKRTPKTSPNGSNGSQGDRFIPNRHNMQFDVANYLLTHDNLENAGSVAEADYKAVVDEQLNTDFSNFRIMSYSNKAPPPPEGHAGNRILYSSSKAPVSSKKYTRSIPKAPERILDAPDIQDDFYLNLVDWSATNSVAVALSSQLYLWNATSGNVSQLAELEEGTVCAVSWSEDGTYLALGTSENEVHLWDVARSKRLRVLTGHSRRVGSLSWNGPLLSSGARSGYVHHHDVRVSQHHVGTLKAHQQEVCGLKWSPDGRFLATGGNDNILNIWPSALSHDTVQPMHVFNHHQSAVKALAWCPWRPSVLASGGGTADRCIRFWNCNLGAHLSSTDTNSQVSSLLWSEEYHELISGHGFAQNQLIIWKYPSMTKVAELTGHTGRVLNMCMSPDGTTVLSAGSDETLRLWNCFALDPSRKKQKQLSQVPSGTSGVLRQSIR
ncbi:cell division cycle protein 20 homolog [Ornithodoros turicata]|uniref:cell division cycle protein 20 homolog n=1 Tax=Ornithodoros turicata TaxID=34597 RepID=UPI00313989B5